MCGWVKLYRNIQDHWIYSFNEPDKTLAWIDLIISASHSGGSFMAKGKLVQFERGQVAASQVSLQKRWKMSQNKVKRFLELLKKEGMIDFETNEQTTIITICNYSSFQDNERPDERATDEPRTTSRTTLKECKERKECKEGKENINRLKKPVLSLLLEFGIDGQLADDFIKHRKSKKAEITETALKGLKREADKAGLPVSQAVEVCIERNWQGFKADWYQEPPKTVTKPNAITEAEINRNARPGETRDQVYRRLQARLDANSTR